MYIKMYTGCKKGPLNPHLAFEQIKIKTEKASGYVYMKKGGNFLLQQKI